MIKIDIDGIKNLIEELENKDKELKKTLKKTTIDCAIILNNEIIKNTPVDSGNLRNNWQLSPKGVEISGNDYKIDLINLVDYASYVNYGHRLINGKWWEGFHFIERGEIISQKFIENIIKLNIEKVIKEIKGVDK